MFGSSDYAYTVFVIANNKDRWNLSWKYDCENNDLCTRAEAEKFQLYSKMPESVATRDGVLEDWKKYQVKDMFTSSTKIAYSESVTKRGHQFYLHHYNLWMKFLKIVNYRPDNRQEVESTSQEPQQDSPNEAPHPNIIARIEALNEEWRECEKDRGLIKGFLAGRKKRKAVEVSPEANEVIAPPPLHIMPGSEGFSENDINQMLTSYAGDGDDDDWEGVIAAV